MMRRLEYSIGYSDRDKDQAANLLLRLSQRVMAVVRTMEVTSAGRTLAACPPHDAGRGGTGECVAVLGAAAACTDASGQAHVS